MAGATETVFRGHVALLKCKCSSQSGPPVQLPPATYDDSARMLSFGHSGLHGSLMWVLCALELSATSLDSASWTPVTPFPALHRTHPVTSVESVCRHFVSRQNHPPSRTSQNPSLLPAAPTLVTAAAAPALALSLGRVSHTDLSICILLLHV